MLKRYCAWHKRYFGKELVMSEVPASPLSVSEIPLIGATHGICDDCRKLVEKEITVKFGPACPDAIGTADRPAWSSACPKCGNHKLLNRNYCFKCEKAILGAEDGAGKEVI